MLPYLFGLKTYFLFWLVAAVCGIAVGMKLVKDLDFRPPRPLYALSWVALAILVGSKLLYLAEHVLFPHDDPAPVGQESLGLMMLHGFRIPGGVLLLAAAFPLIARRFAVSSLRFADATMPAVGVAVFCIRIGCFLNGCCFGSITEFPVAITFPPGARVYEWQMLQGHIAGPAPYTLAVHPLQLYFALLGLLMFVMGRQWLASKRFDGEVAANCFVLFFGGTFLLEFLRPAPLHLNLVLTASVAIVTLLIRVRSRSQSEVVAGARS